ncbi:MAG TPA: AMP-dependent synthetase/ligase [Pirellulales bacterium]|nr:AMP-dependent synthetase/ligase [Pirellulales bacterium]
MHAAANLTDQNLPPEWLDATVISLFAERLEQAADQPAIQYRSAGAWQTSRWSDVADDVRRAAAVLADLGVRPGDRVAQFSPNRYEWIMADLAIQTARAVHVPIHASLAPPQVAYQVADSGAKVVLLAGPEQSQSLLGYYGEHREQLPHDVCFVCYDPCPRVGSAEASCLRDRMMHADESLADRLWHEARSHLAPDDLATILYTSGTTGEPKGVMLNQRNLATNALGTLAAFGSQPDDLRLAWLPMSHIFARTCDVYTWVAGGGRLALAEGPDSVSPLCREVQPTLINGVPYFFEKVQRYLVDKGMADIPGVLGAAFGGRLRAACSGGAPLPDHVAQFYNDRGVFLGQGYGLTESSPVISASTPGVMKIGTAGRPIPGVEVKIAPDGEILTRGPHVMLGYWNKPAATAESLRDGWLHTGDLGSLDEEGFLRITGRKKELIVTAAGKKAVPSHLESLLKADPLVEQAVVLGDGRSYLSALIVPNREALAAELRRLGKQVELAEAVRDRDVIALYEQRIKERLACVSYYEQVVKFAILDRPLSVERGELTLTLKLRRDAIYHNFAETIEAMYK